MAGGRLLDETAFVRTKPFDSFPFANYPEASYKDVVLSPSSDALRFQFQRPLKIQAFLDEL